MSAKFDFGDLNPVDEGMFGSRSIHPTETNSLKFLRDFAVNKNKDDASINNGPYGPYMAEVLFVYPSTTKQEAGSGFNFWSLSNDDT